MRGITSMRIGVGALLGLASLAYLFGGRAAWVILAAGALAGLFAAWEGLARLRHRDASAAFAASHGWTHTPRTAKYSLRFSGMPFDLSGTSVRQEDVLEGRYGGARCATFTHVVETQRDGDRTTAQVFQVTLAELDVRLPRLDIVPESLAGRIAQAFGGIDIEVESHAFNERWRVIARDRRYGHDVVDPRMIERLLQWDAEGRALRIDGGAVLMWSSGREGVDTLAKRLDVVSGVARRIPAHVLRRYADEGQEIPDPDAPLAGPDWAVTPGALTSRRYTGIGVEDPAEPGEATLGMDDEPR
ncbi:hypothetical protein [Demequina soli]|uniref:hypothetical protein n=1 Tax=Demequina soli TaxID=1638987 RepID=UPI00078608A8|nr:hypothetical protein [Demequina soli]